MKQKSLFLITTFIVLYNTISAQGQYAIEANYGLSGVFEPSSNEFKHFGAGISYDFNEVYGIKLDFASDKFRPKNDISNLETGINVTRISLQGTLNLSKAIKKGKAKHALNVIKKESNPDFFNLIAHAGGGVSTIKPIDNSGNDNAINVIMGLTPNFKITEGLYFSLDTSLIFNIAQHYNFDGSLAYEKTPNSFTGITYSVTGGIIYKIRAY